MFAASLQLLQAASVRLANVGRWVEQPLVQALPSMEVWWPVIVALPVLLYELGPLLGVLLRFGDGEGRGGQEHDVDERCLALPLVLYLLVLALLLVALLPLPLDPCCRRGGSSLPSLSRRHCRGQGQWRGGGAAERAEQVLLEPVAAKHK